MIRIKICGITNIEDAFTAYTLGADALGFVFAKSPRQIDKDIARELALALPPFLHLVGVFVDEEKEVVEDMAHFCRLTVLQFHGSEPPEYCLSFNRRVIKAFRISRREDIEGMKPYRGIVSAFLLDTYHPHLIGGTGKSFDWRIASDARKMGPIVLAGGLNPDNVQAAIRTVRPYAVDVSSSIEREPGKKDPGKMRRFIEKARAA